MAQSWPWGSQIAVKKKCWLRKVKGDKTKYHCTVCNKTHSLSASGRFALTEHARGNKNIKNVTKRRGKNVH